MSFPSDLCESCAASIYFSLMSFHPQPNPYSANLPQRRGPPIPPPLLGQRNYPPPQQVRGGPPPRPLRPQPNSTVQSSTSRRSSSQPSSSRNPKPARASRIRKTSKTKRKIRHQRKFPTGLNAKTAFYIKQLRFAPPQPKIITGPKFYTPVVPSDILYQYRPNTFGTGHHMRLHTSAHLGLPIPLVVPPKKLKKPEKKLDHQDLILLGEKKSKKGKKLYKTQFSWLRKTEYISSNKPGLSQGGKAGLLGLPGDGVLGMGRLSKAKDGWFDVEKSFSDIKKDQITMKHPTKRGVVMEDSFEVFPDFSRWQNELVNIHFNADFKPKRGMLIRQPGMKKELNFYENLCSPEQQREEERAEELDRLLNNTNGPGHVKEGEKFAFKKNFSIDTFPNENMFSISFDQEKKQANVNPLAQFYVLKKNPYKTKNNPPLVTKCREKTKGENEFVKKKMKQIGMEIQ